VVADHAIQSQIFTPQIIRLVWFKRNSAVQQIYSLVLHTTSTMNIPGTNADIDTSPLKILDQQELLDGTIRLHVVTIGNPTLEAVKKCDVLSQFKSLSELSTNKLLSSAWLDRLGLAWFPQIKLPIVDSKLNQAVIEGLLDRLDRLDSSKHISCL
jgi:hypothetical protein